MHLKEYKITIPFLIFFVICYNTICSSQSNNGVISGRITDSKGNPLSNVNIIILGTDLGTASDSEGNYRIENLVSGLYRLKFMSIGYEAVIKEDVDVADGKITQLNAQMIEKAIEMQEIVVTPGNFSIAQKQTAKRQFIDKERIVDVPATLNDICRVLQIMPGIAFSDDFSAHFHVRGGKQNENLILLDGMEIFDPYHLKHIGGAVGVMNMELIENVSVLTGGFPAKYGDKLSSVVAVQNRAGDTEKFRGNFSGGGTGFSLFLEGPVLYGSWLISARKSFLKEAAEILNPTDYAYSPSFYDVQGKVSLAANNNNQFIYNFLYSKDNSYLEKWRGDSELNSDYGNNYNGLVWRKTFSPKFFWEIIVSRGENFWNNKIGDEKEEKLNLVENVATWNFSFEPLKNHNIETGLAYKYISYDYELDAADLSQGEQDLEELAESVYGDTKINPKTYKLAAFVQDKFRIFKSLYTNIGVRYDYFEYNQDQHVSPRLGLAYNLTSKTILRGAWGYFYQSPIYTELTNIKGSENNPESERSVHYVLGIEHQFSDRYNIRVEVYQKSLERMIGHYYEFEDDEHVIKYGNPNEGLARGIEFFFNGQFTNRWSLWGTYAYSRTELERLFVNWEKLTVEPRTIPRFTDQPHNLSLFTNYTFPKSWELNIKWRYLSGIPYTPEYADWRNDESVWRNGEAYSARYPAYHRLDIRIGKRFFFSRYVLSTFLEIKNVYNHNNVLFYDYKIENNQHVRKVYHTLPFLPTIEFNFAF